MIESFNKNVFTDATLRRISENTGITSYSEGSKIANLLKTMNENMYRYIAEIKVALDNSIASTADEGFLEAIGISKGRPRFVQPIGYSTSEAEGLFLATANGINFPVIQNNETVLTKGTRIEIGGSMRLYISQDVVLLSNVNAVPVRGVLEPITSAPLVVNANQRFLADGELYPAISGLEFLFTKQIRVKTQVQDINEYRASVILAAQTPINGSFNSVSEAIRSIPGIKQFATENSLGKVRIGLLTEDMAQTGYDVSFDLYRSLVLDALQLNGAHGIQYEIYQPRKLELGIRLGSSVSVEEFNEDRKLILDSFFSSYSYTRDFNFNSTIDFVNSARRTLDTQYQIDSVFLYDEQLNDYINIDKLANISLPSNYYLFFSEEGVQLV